MCVYVLGICVCRCLVCIWILVFLGVCVFLCVFREGLLGCVFLVCLWE